MESGEGGQPVVDVFCGLVVLSSWYFVEGACVCGPVDGVPCDWVAASGCVAQCDIVGLAGLVLGVRPWVCDR